MTLQEQLNIPREILDKVEFLDPCVDSKLYLIFSETWRIVEVYDLNKYTEECPRFCIQTKQKPVTEDDTGKLVVPIGGKEKIGILAYLTCDKEYGDERRVVHVGDREELFKEVRLATPQDFPHPDRIKEQAKGWIKKDLVEFLENGYKNAYIEEKEGWETALNHAKEWLGGFE